jgi:flagellar hook-length control protein FliK
MSIERSGAASGPKPATAAEGQGGKGKVKSGAEADAPDGGGFLALLTSLEPVAEQVDAGATSLSIASDPSIVLLPTSELLVPMPLILPTEDEPQIAQLRTPAPTISLPLVSPTDLTMLPAQSSQVAGSMLSSFGDEAPGASRGHMNLAAPAIGADKLGVSISPSAPLSTDESVDFSQTVKSLLDQMSQGKSGRSHRAGSVELQSGATASLADARAIKQPALMEVSAREPALSGALVTSGMGDGLLRQADRAVAKASVFTSGYGAEGAWGQHAVQAGNRVDAPPVIASSAAQSLESKVADTVSYWVTQGVQNAQLKLDGFGGEPVEVSISLKGDEAHVGFRTDQPEIRQILEGAVAQLKELLGKEGLVLSGVSVGASGQEGAGPQEQRHRPGVRQASVVTTEVVPAEGLRRPVNPAVGRAVDLFV